MAAVPSGKTDTWSGRLSRRWRKLEKVERNTKQVVGDGTSLHKGFGLAGLEGEQHGRGMELVVDGRERWPLSLKRSSTQP